MDLEHDWKAWIDRARQARAGLDAGTTGTRPPAGFVDRVIRTWQERRSEAARARRLIYGGSALAASVALAVFLACWDDVVPWLRADPVPEHLVAVEVEGPLS